MRYVSRDIASRLYMIVQVITALYVPLKTLIKDKRHMYRYPIP